MTYAGEQNAEKQKPLVILRTPIGFIVYWPPWWIARKKKEEPK